MTEAKDADFSHCGRAVPAVGESESKKVMPSPKWGFREHAPSRRLIERRGIITMKHRHQMSLIVRRAQIRRAAASRKSVSSDPTSIRPHLRLVVSNSLDDSLKATSGHDARPLPFE